MRSRKRRAELVDRADDLVAGDDGHFLLRQVALDHVQIGAADGAAADANPHLARPRLGHRQIGQFQRRRVDRSNSTQQHGFHGSTRSRLLVNRPRVSPIFVLANRTLCSRLRASSGIGNLNARGGGFKVGIWPEMREAKSS